jgi:alpha-L-rhamnosidase
MMTLSPTYRTVFGLLLCSATLGVQAKPPTLDPTYGLPLPAAKAPTVAASQASWIWAGTTKDEQTIDLRRTFELKALPKSATLYLTADNFFTLFVNGKEVDHSAADPNNINVWQHVHTVDLMPYLAAGKNTLAVRAVNAGGVAGFVARLELPGQAAVETDGTWKVSSEASTTDEWTAIGFDDSAWSPATVVAPLNGGVWSGAGGLLGWPGYDTSVPYLAHLALPFAGVVHVNSSGGKIEGADSLAGHLGAILTVTPAATGATETPSLTLDFGKEIAGRVQFDGLTPGTIVAGTGESLEEAEKSPWTGTHSLTLTPGTPAYTPYSAFRYVHLVFPSPSTGTPAPLKLRVTMDHKYYPVQYGGGFDCSDPLLTKLWYTGAYTAHLCMQEDIWDAPKRDRARWIGDLHVSGRVIDTVFADKFLMEQTMQRLRDDAQGGLPATELPRGHVNGIPGYSCAWICTLADFHKHLADYAYLNKQHDALVTLLGYMQGELDAKNLFANKRGAWPFVDWSPGFDGDTPSARAATQMFYVQAAHDAVYLLGEMGDTANAAKYAAWGDTLTQAARQSLLDPTANTYGDRLQENAMAVYSGVATPEQQRAIYAAVLNPDSPAWDKTGTPPYNNGVISPYYNNYVIYAMSRTGHTADTLRVLRDYWGAMLAEGATTCWEAYDPHWPKADSHANLYADGNHGYFVSLCHGWSSGPTSWLTERVLGIRPTGAGYRTAEIAPDLGDLSWAEGDVPTPHGPIHVRAEKADNGLAVQVTLPPGVDAQVRLTGRMVRLNKAGTYSLKP